MTDQEPSESQGNTLFAGAVFCVALSLAALTLYAVLRPEGEYPLARAPAPGAAPLPERPTSSVTGQASPLPGDRASGTVGGPSVRIAPPPVLPAKPVVDDKGPPLPATQNQTPPEHPPVTKR